VSERPEIGLRLVTFSALAAFAAANWVALVADPPTGRAMLAALCAAIGALCLLAIAARLPSRWRAAAVAGAVIAAIILLAALALGLPARLLLPSGWSELGADLGDGIGSIWKADYPYEGGETWSRLALLLALAPLLGLAAALTFWPGPQRRRWPQRAGLVVLLATYGIAATVSPPSHPLLSGALLFVLVAACLWSPSRGRSAALSLGVVAAAGLAAIPVAARLDASEPWLDYRNWDFGSASAADVTFDWNHSYGSIDWSRDGSKLLDIQSSRPHYWATEVLDHFNGIAWVGSETGPGIDLPLRADGSPVGPLNSKWVMRARFEVGELSSRLLIGAGRVLSVSGVKGAHVSTEGISVTSPLGEGDSYEIRAYDPRPSAARMRASEGRYPVALDRYTALDVPQVGSIPAPSPNIQSPPASITLRSVTVPLRDGPAVAPSPEVAGSAYAPVYRLARRLADGKPTAYEVAESMQRYLRSNYAYDESPPPARLLPLSTFLVGDKRGYCQHFSGAMALMLRMVGIPSRVVGGFAPGEKGSNGFAVSDFDAHSWVQVYFNNIGWVTFDPTPSAAPAISRSGDSAQVARGPRPFEFRTGSKATKLPSFSAAEPTQGKGGGAPLGWIAFLALIAASLTAGVTFHRRRVARLRSLAPAALAELQAAELERAAAELTGRGRRPGITLRGLESRLRGARQAAAATYATQLRDCLYGPRGGPAPNARQRGAARRELAKRQGFGARLRSWLLMPPGGPLGPRRSRPA
jgi:transglutaminase-like putative cysteine protease